jgi:hypothetical protein
VNPEPLNFYVQESRADLIPLPLLRKLQKKLIFFISAGRRILMDYFRPESNPDNKNPQNPGDPV